MASRSALAKNYFTKSNLPRSHKNQEVVNFTDWQGGLNTRHKPMDLNINELADIVNFRFNVSSYGVGLISREGATRLTTTPTGYPIVDIGYYVNTDTGVTYTLGVSNSVLYYYSLAAWHSIGTLGGTRGRGIQFANKFIICDGSYLKYFDGTTLGMCNDTAGFLVDNTALTNNGSTALYSGSVVKAGQHLTLPNWAAPGYTINIETVDVILSKTGTPTGNLVCKIYASDGTTVLATSANLDVSTLTTDPFPYTIDFTTTYALVPNTVYYIVFEYSGGDSSDKVNVYYSTQTTGLGTYVTYTGSTWSTDAAKDCLFAVSPGLPPKSSFCLTWYDRLLVNDTVNKNRLHHSNVRDPNDWSTVDASGYTIFSEGVELTGMHEFYSTVMLHFGNGPKFIKQRVGATPAEYTDTFFAKGISAISVDTIKNIGNDAFFLDSPGVMSLAAWNKYGNIEQSIVSKSVEDQIFPVISSARFAGACLTDQQYWLDINTSYFLVRDSVFGGWTKYQYNLGTGITPSCFTSINGVDYFGDSDGHLWYINRTSPVYQDNSVDYSLLVKMPIVDLGTRLKKQARYADIQAVVGLGGSFNFNFYKDNSSIPVFTEAVSLPVGFDTLVKDLTFLVSAWTTPLADQGSTLKEYRLNFEFTSLQIGLDTFAANNSQVFIDRVSTTLALLGRM